MSIRKKVEALPASAWQSDTVSFRPLSDEMDVVYAVDECRLTEEQQEMVNPAWFTIGRAYLHPQDHYPCLICDEKGDPIGFIDLDRWLGNGESYSWSYFIDCDHQGKGYGTAAGLLAIRLLRQADPNMPIKLAVEKDNARAQKLYRALGFALLDEMDGDDLVFGL